MEIKELGEFVVRERAWVFVAHNHKGVWVDMVAPFGESSGVER